MSSSSSARSQTARKSASLTRAVSTLPYFKNFRHLLDPSHPSPPDMVEAWATLFKGAGYPRMARVGASASRCARRHGPPLRLGDGAGRRVAECVSGRHLSRVYEIGYLLETAQAPCRLLRGFCLREPFRRLGDSLRAPACPARSAGFSAFDS